MARECPMCGGNYDKPSKLPTPVTCRVQKNGWKQHVFTSLDAFSLHVGSRCDCGEKVIEPGQQVLTKDGGCYTVGEEPWSSSPCSASSAAGTRARRGTTSAATADKAASRRKKSRSS